MKFENAGKWMKEAEEDKLVFDNREPADYLNGDDEICTLKTEDDESDYDDDFSGELLDEVESDEDELESPDNEEDAIIMADESAQKNEGPEEFKTDKYKEDFFEYKNGGHGSFMEYLAKACMLADKKNLAKIQKEFPELTKSFCLWKSSGRTDKVEKL